MFSGIITATGNVIAEQPRADGRRLHVAAEDLGLQDVRIGDSIAVNGVCLTVTDIDAGRFGADVSNETLGCTTLGRLQAGDRVNLEKALLPTTRLSGHLVSGHVDGVGTVRDCFSDGESLRMRLQAPEQLARYIAAKGSICIDGVSLTVNRVGGAEFECNIVPHTRHATTLGAYRAHREVNIEVDLVARYLERLLAATRGTPQADNGITLALLKESGFID